MDQHIEETPYSLGLLCEGCDHHAKVVGFRRAPEAYAYAKHALGWFVEAEGVFCPDCRPEATLSTPTINMIAEESPLWHRVRNDVVKGREVRCTKEEWPEIRTYLTEYIDILFADRRWVYASVAEKEKDRLDNLYGDSQEET